MADADLPLDAFPVSERNRVRRKPDRGRYDRATVHAILDAALMAHARGLMHWRNRHRREPVKYGNGWVARHAG